MNGFLSILGWYYRRKIDTDYNSASDISEIEKLIIDAADKTSLFFVWGTFIISPDDNICSPGVS